MTTEYDLGKNSSGAFYRFLVVDDSPWMIKALDRAITSFHGEVVGAAASADEAIAFLKANPNWVDVITLDIHMPDRDGISIIPEIKALSPTSKIIMVSSIGNEEKVKEAIMVGANHFVVKPFAVEGLYQVVNTVLNP
jgi:two-component system chemotaxis response regulator CheY